MTMDYQRQQFNTVEDFTFLHRLKYSQTSRSASPV